MRLESKSNSSFNLCSGYSLARVGFVNLSKFKMPKDILNKFCITKKILISGVFCFKSINAMIGKIHLSVYHIGNCLKFAKETSVG